MGVRLPGRARVGERRADAALAGEVVELLGPDVADERDERAGVANVAPHRAEPLVPAEGRLGRCDVANGRVHRPSLGEQPAHEEVPVLPRCARDERGPGLDGATHAVRV